MSFRMKRKSDSILLIYSSPDYLSSMFFFGVLLIVTLYCVIKGAILSLIGVVIIVGFIALVVNTWKERELYCAINRATGVIAYTKGGVLTTRYDLHKVRYQVAEVMALEIKRYMSHYWDTFQIRLVLVGNRIIPLSSPELDFSECQAYVNEVHQFIGINKPIRAID